LSQMTSHALFITLLFLVATVAVGPLMRSHPMVSDPSLNMAAVKVAGIAVLAMSHGVGVALHPFLAPPKIAFLTHFKSFGLWLPVALVVGHILTEYGYNPGYPVLPSTSPLSAFMVPYAVFTAYLLLFTTLIRKGRSRQWANLALVAVLVAVNAHLWHPNPLVIAVSIQANGFKWVYAVHLVAIAMAVVTMKRVNAYLAPPSPPQSPSFGLSVGALGRILVSLKGRSARLAKSQSPKK
jgi:hypothetical protein